MKISLFILLFFIGTLTYAQDLKVKVVSGSEPLGYAYVFINNKIYASVDSLGVTYIPRNKLKLGDTISASFVGTESNSVIYDSDLITKNDVTIDLAPNITTDEIIVTAKDRSKQLFRKYVNPRISMAWFIQYDFNYKIYNNANEIMGELIYANLPLPYVNYTNEKIITIPSHSDSTYCKLVMTIYEFSMSYAGMKNWYTFNEDIEIKYRGRDNGNHIFLIIRPYMSSATGGSQTLLYVDENTKEIVKTRSINIYDGNIILNISSSYSLFYITGKIAMLYPDKVNCTYSDPKFNGGKAFEIEIDNVKVSQYKTTRIPRSVIKKSENK